MVNTYEWPAFTNFLLKNEVSIETSDLAPSPPVSCPLPSGILDLLLYALFAFHAILLQRESWMEISPCLLWVIGLHPNHKI